MVAELKKYCGIANAFMYEMYMALVVALYCIFTSTAVHTKWVCTLQKYFRLPENVKGFIRCVFFSCVVCGGVFCCWVWR